MPGQWNKIEIKGRETISHFENEGTYTPINTNNHWKSDLMDKMSLGTFKRSTAFLES